MQEITSVSNTKVKETVKLKQKKYRNETGLFLLEGFKPVYEAFASGVDINCVFTTQKHVEKFKFLAEKLILTTEAVLEKISTTESLPEAVAIAKQKNITLDDIKNSKRIALVENIKDAGNLGTLIRSACAFSLDAVVLTGDTIDIYNPKVVRSAVGALFKINIVKTGLEEAKNMFNSHNFIATVVNHKEVVRPETIDYAKPFVIMLGSEADGLSSEAVRLSDIKTTIPMTDVAESLNLSVAGSLMFYLSSQGAIL